MFVCNFADFFTRFKNGLSAYYSSCSLDVRCRLCSKLCVLLSKMSIQQILIQLCDEIILIYSNWQQNNYVPTVNIMLYYYNLFWKIVIWKIKIIEIMYRAVCTSWLVISIEFPIILPNFHNIRGTLEENSYLYVYYWIFFQSPIYVLCT